MKKRSFLLCLIIIFAAEIAVLTLFIHNNTNHIPDSVMVNEAVQSVKRDWHTIKNHQNATTLDYTVLNRNGEVIFRTKQGLSESINAAVIHRDTILDITIEDTAVGKIIIYNDSIQILHSQKKKTVILLIIAIAVQFAACAIYLTYLCHTIIRPFQKLKGFAESVAGGNLDIPLKIDRQNIFGAFTESFDIMRTELKKAKIAEARSNAAKKELVAKLSHDIRTPVASIKATAEVGAAIAPNKKTQQSYNDIIHKADQINTLITNLFSATLEELTQLQVDPVDLKSSEIVGLLERADYYHYARIPDIPDCLVWADKLRLQQVFDNIFANSYKYANTKIDITVSISGDCLAVKIEDYGSRVSDEELPLLKEKFKRGANSQDIEGAGLGLYISDSFMKEMRGELVIQNGQNGLAVTVFIALSGTI